MKINKLRLYNFYSIWRSLISQNNFKVNNLVTKDNKQLNITNINYNKTQKIQIKNKI